VCPLQTAGIEGTRLTAMEAVQELGLKGLYRGAPATLARDIPFSVCFFSSYGWLKVRGGVCGACVGGRMEAVWGVVTASRQQADCRLPCTGSPGGQDLPAALLANVPSPQSQPWPGGGLPQPCRCNAAPSNACAEVSLSLHAGGVANGLRALSLLLRPLTYLPHCVNCRPCTKFNRTTGRKMLMAKPTLERYSSQVGWFWQA